MPHPRQLGGQGTSGYHGTSITSTSGSYPSVAEKQTLNAFSVRTIDQDLRPACRLSEIAQLYAALPNLCSLVMDIGQNRVQLILASQFYAALCKWTSGNTPSTHSGE